MESIDDTLTLLGKLKTLVANKNSGKRKHGAQPGVLRLKRLKNHLVSNGQRTAVNVNVSDLRDDLKDLDKDDDDFPSDTASSAALARRKRLAQYKRKPKKKQKKKKYQWYGIEPCARMCL